MLVHTAAAIVVLTVLCMLLFVSVSRRQPICFTPAHLSRACFRNIRTLLALYWLLSFCSALQRPLQASGILPCVCCVTVLFVNLALQLLCAIKWRWHCTLCSNNLYSLLQQPNISKWQSRNETIWHHKAVAVTQGSRTAFRFNG